jgi:NTP pyrophosphatase (non-canonical NTP hydrolase)
MNLHERTVAYYGAHAQIEKVIEECGELVVAIQHHRLGRITDEDLALEMADVDITLRSARLVIGAGLYDSAVSAKLERLGQRLDAADSSIARVDTLTEGEPTSRLRAVATVERGSVSTRPEAVEGEG